MSTLVEVKVFLIVKSAKKMAKNHEKKCEDRRKVGQEDERKTLRLLHLIILFIHHLLLFGSSFDTNLVCVQALPYTCPSI